MFSCYQEHLDERLYIESCSGNLNQIKNLLNHGADPNAISSEFRDTPLYAAMSGNFNAAAALLVHAGAKCRLKGEHGAAIDVALTPQLKAICRNAIDW